MTQQSIVFGEYHHLVGIVAHPQENSQPCNDVAAIFVTAGMLHSAGPFRLHADLADALCESNIRSLRFDLSGIGESLGVGTSGRSIDRAAHEISMAMNWLSENFGTQKFILFGLCSGADDSVQAAVNDDRVVGVVTLDGCGYRTPKYYLHRLWSHYARRLIMPSKWISLFRKLAGKKDLTAASLQTGTDVREFPAQAQAVTEFQLLVDRGVQMHFVYTGGVGEYYNHADQFFDMLSAVQWKQQATTEFYADMDHVVRLCEDREKLVVNLASRIAAIASTHQSVEVEAEQCTFELDTTAPQATAPIVIPTPLSDTTALVS